MTAVQGPFSKSGNQAEVGRWRGWGGGDEKADFQGISMISENTKSIVVLSRGLL